jgi:DNA-binding SARP family transcriptional activator
MLFLRTFGGLLLQDGTAPLAGPAVQPRRLAVLAVLATGGDSGLMRDQLCAFFWPDTELGRARGSLKQALHAIRRGVGEPHLVIGANQLRLNPAVITSDVGAFRQALVDGNLAGAISHYSGPFLDGVHIRGTSDFERWADENRRALANKYADALEKLSGVATSAFDTATALDWARRLNAADVLNTRAALLLVNALDAAGDRSSAIRQGELHVRLLWTELGVEPSVAFTLALTRLRAAPQSDLRIDSAVKQPPSEPPSSRVADVERAPIVTASPTQVGDAPTRRWQQYAPAALGAALAATAVAFFILQSQSRALATVHERDERLLIVPFESDSGLGGASLRTRATSLLATALQGVPHVNVVEPLRVLTYAPKGIHSDIDAASVSQHFDAGYFARGSVLVEGSRVTLRATIHDSRAPASSRFSVEAEGSADSLVAIANRLASEFLAAEYPASRRALVQAAARSTASLDAFKAYLVGNDAMDQKRYTAALKAYQRAVAIDPTFALAYYNLSIAADWAPNDAIREASDMALRTSTGLGEHERLLIMALRAWRYDDFDEAERLYRRLTENWRDDVEAHFRLAEVLFHGNPVRGRSFLESEPEFLRVLSLDSHNDEARLHLARIAAWLGDRRRADSLLKTVIAATPDSQSLELRTFRAAVLGDRAEFGRLAATFENRDDGAIFTACTRIAVWARDLTGAEQLCRILTHPNRSPVSRALGRLLLAQLAMAGGERNRARSELTQVPDVGETRRLAFGAWMETLPGVPQDTSSVRAQREELQRFIPSLNPPTDDRFLWLTRGWISLRHYYLALLDRALGDGLDAAREGVALQSGTPPIDTLRRTYLRSLSARVALEDGRMADAISLSVPPKPATAGDDFCNSSDRFVRAEALAAIGHRRDALDSYGSFDGAYISDLVLSAPAHLRRAAMLENDHLIVDARNEYDIALALWRRPDPEFQSMLQDARRHRAALGQ